MTMSRLMPRRARTRLAAGILTSGVILAAFLFVADLDRPPSAVAQLDLAAEAVAPNPDLAGRTWSISTERFDKNVRTTTISFAQFDDQGRIVQYRNTTATTDGHVVQEQAFKDGLEVVNYADWMGTGMACSEVLDFEIAGTGIPIVTESYLKAKGFTPVPLPSGFGFTGTERAFESRSPDRPFRGFKGSAAVVVASDIGGLELARLVYGIDETGAATLVSSYARSFEAVEAPPPDAFALTPLPACAGHHPSTSGGQR